MISKSQKERLQKHLKKDWIQSVFIELKRQNITSSRGTPYRESMIRMVFIGKIEHDGIEQAIFDVFESRKLEFETSEKNKERILSQE